MIGAAILRQLRWEGFSNVTGDPENEPDFTDANQVDAFFERAAPGRRRLWIRDRGQSQKARSHHPQSPEWQDHETSKWLGGKRVWVPAPQMEKAASLCGGAPPHPRRSCGSGAADSVQGHQVRLPCLCDQPQNESLAGVLVLFSQSQNRKTYSQRIIEVYHQAVSAGAVGGKLTGTGGSSFLLLFVPPDRRERVRVKLEALIRVPFRFEFSGSQILFFDSEEDFAAQDAARAERPVRAFVELEGN